MNVREARAVIDTVFAAEQQPEITLAQLRLIAQHVQRYIDVLENDFDGEPLQVAA